MALKPFILLSLVALVGTRCLGQAVTNSPATPTPPPGPTIQPIVFSAYFNTSDMATRWSGNRTVTSQMVYNTSNVAPQVIFSFSSYKNESSPDDALLPSDPSLIIFYREDWFLDMVNYPDWLRVWYGITSVSFNFNTPIPATQVPPDFSFTPAASFNDGSLQFMIRTAFDYHYSQGIPTPHGGLAPNVTLMQWNIATLVGLPFTDIDRIQFVYFLDGLTMDNRVRLMYYPLGYYVSFKIGTPSPAQLAGPSVNSIYRKLMYAQQIGAIAKAVEGGVELTWADTNQLTTYDSYAEEGMDIYFNQKVIFFVGLVISGGFSLGYLGLVWFWGRNKQQL
jgi:hypothetical protein